MQASVSAGTNILTQRTHIKHALSFPRIHHLSADQARRNLALSRRPVSAENLCSRGSTSSCSSPRPCLQPCISRIPSSLHLKATCHWGWCKFPHPHLNRQCTDAGRVLPAASSLYYRPETNNKPAAQSIHPPLWPPLHQQPQHPGRRSRVPHSRLPALAGPAAAGLPSDDDVAIQGLHQQEGGSGRPSALRAWLLKHAPALASRELLRRLGYTLMLVAFARLGYFIPLHGLDMRFLPRHVGMHVEDMFGGVGQVPVSIYALGVGPIIEGSIVLSVLTVLSRDLKALHEDGTEMSVNTLRQYSNAFALAIALFAAAYQAVVLRPYALAREGFMLSTVLTLTAGVAIHKYIAEQVQEHGLGEGTSLLICTSILAGFARVLDRAYAAVVMLGLPAGRMAGMLALYVLFVLAAVWLSATELRLPLTYFGARYSQRAPKRAGRVSKRDSEPTPLTQQGYLPLRINPNGLGPIMFASIAVYTIPALVAAVLPAASGPISAIIGSRYFPLLYGGFVFLAAVVDFSAGGNARRMADFLSKSDTGVVGISPGEPTQVFLRQKQSQLTCIGGFLVALLAVAALTFDRYCESVLGASLNTISLLLLVSLLLSAFRQVKSLAQLPAIERSLQHERDILQESAY